MVLPEFCHEEDSDVLISCTKCEEWKLTTGDEQQFLKSMSIWINKPHVINRRLCGSKFVHVRRTSSKDEVRAVLQEYKLFYKEEQAVDDVSQEKSCSFTDLTDETEDFTVIVRELIPKSEFFSKLLEAVVYDKHNVKVSFITIDQQCKGETEDIRPTYELCYQFQLATSDESSPELDPVNEIQLAWSCDHTETVQVRRQITSLWLKTTLLQKLVKWSQVQGLSTAVTSLQLVPVDQYKITYLRLKNTYGRELVENWTERTDPKKFVYEDVAIAAYLMLIWEVERREKNLTQKQSFVDLGCGNGLLVYILTREGHKGLGIDLRRRNIWSTFGPGIDLQEKVISPSGDHLYRGYDWIIGNHSDELTPWIPVIAARSSYNTSFFVLPCCPHDFTGKFNMTEKGKSRYASYMDYVKDVIEHCGFVPEADILRIPSTKRMCFIGKNRSYKPQQEREMDAQRQAFIDKRTIYNLKQRLEKPGINQAVSKISKDKECVSSCILTEKHMPFETHISANADEVNSCSSHSEKRKYESISSLDSGLSSLDSGFGSLDSGFSEVECDGPVEDTCTKRHKGDCGKEDCKLLNTDQGGEEESVGECSDTTSNLSPHFYTNSSDKRISDAQEIKAQNWVKGFQPRVEPGVRNCQRVPEQVKSQFVQVAFKLVLVALDATRVTLPSGKTWNRGGSIPLSQIVDRFDKTAMQELKNECGGLQTLLRNHSHIFQVTGGNVHLRDFTAANPWNGCNVKKGRKNSGNQEHTRKTTLCWFAVNHPDGCPKTNNDCHFAHGIEELREKLAREKIS